MIYSVVSVSGIQRNGSVIRRLFQNIEYSSLCVLSRSLLVFYFIYSLCLFQTPGLSTPPLSPLVTMLVFYVSGFISFLYISVYLYFLNYTHKWYHMTSFFIWLTSFSMIILGPSMLLEMALFIFWWLSTIPSYIMELNM